MRNGHIKNFHNFPPEVKRKILCFANVSRFQIDKTSSDVWGILSQEQIWEIQQYLNWEITELWSKTQKSMTHFLEVVSSILWHPGNLHRDISRLIHSMMNNPWLALEYFLADSIARFWQKKVWDTWDINVEMSSRKAPLEFDRKHKVDLLTQANIDGEIFKFWVQVTTSRSPRIDKKESEMSELLEKIDTPWNIFEWKTFDDFCMIDSALLMIVNGDVWKHINGEWKSDLKDAFERWNDRGFSTGGPIQHIKNHTLKKWINVIWGTYPFAVYEIIKFLKKWKKESSTWLTIVRETEKERYYLEYNREKNTIEVSVRRKKKITKKIKKTDGKISIIHDYTFPDEFDYSLKLFLSKKLLDRFGIRIKRTKKNSRKHVDSWICNRRKPPRMKKRRAYC